MTDINTSDSNHQQTSSATASTHAISQSEAALWSFTGVELIDASDELTLLLDTASEKRLLVRKEVAIALTTVRLTERYEGMLSTSSLRSLNWVVRLSQSSLFSHKFEMPGCCARARRVSAI